MKCKLHFLILQIFLILAIGLSACTPVQPAPGVISLTDGLGRKVSLAGPAQRIVSLAPSHTETLFALGAGSQVVGRDQFSNFPPEADKVQVVGDFQGKLNLELILTLKPDLVLAAGISTPEQVKSLEDLQITVVALENPKTFDDLYQNITTVGKLIGRTGEAETLIASMKDRVSAVEKKMSGVTLRPKVFYELDGTDPAKPWTTGPGTFIDLLITKAGGENIGAGLGTEWAQISLEELIVQDPDIILLGDSGFGTTAEMVSQRAGWDGIPAVKAGKVYPFDDDQVSRPGPRLADGLEAMAKAFHPELFR